MKPLAPDSAPLLTGYFTLKESWVTLGWWLLIRLLIYLVILGSLWLVGKPLAAVGASWRFLLPCAANLFTVWFLWRRVGPTRWAGLRWLSTRERWQSYALLPIIVVGSGLVLSLQSFLHLPNLFASQLDELTRHPGLALVIGCVVAPVTEELLCRGVVLRGLLRKYQPAVAIGQSALLFGIMHLNPAQSFNAFFVGLLFGWVYYQSQSLLLCCCLHGLYNSLAFSGRYFNHVSAHQQAMRPHLVTGSYAVLVVAGALMLAGALWLLHRYRAPTVSGPLAGYHTQSSG